mmetsp:Transcript_10166/g.22905  ORF Transcript_10166/g.22905 Transcript_10166/m.22905 type:complete len:413 (-) Transcript_10166:109-1347(-)
MLSKRDLEEALAHATQSDLLAMSKRLSRSVEEMSSYHSELLAEQEELRKEGAGLRESIETKMKDIVKLDIGAMNLREPELEEGPLDFIGRFWEKVKPRDNTVVISEHIGELKQAPRDWEEPVNPINELKDQLNIAADAWGKATERLREQGTGLISAAKEWGQDMNPVDGSPDGEKSLPRPSPLRIPSLQGEAVGKLVSDAQEMWPPTAARLSGAMSAFSAFAGSLREQAAEKWPGVVSPSKYQDWGSGVLGPFHTEQEEPEVVPGFENVAGILRPASVPAANPAEAPAEEPAAAATSAAAEEDAPETDVRPTTPQTQSPEPAETEQAREEDEELSLMIEASITLDDGSVEVLRMKSCERASEAAARFVQEHSLKAWFEEPLRKYLKQVEEDAIRFPAKVEGDLSEIRRMFRK